MPQAFVVVATWVGTALFAAGVPILVASAIATVFYYASIAFVLNRAMAMLQKKPKGDANHGLEVAISDSGSEGYAIYGTIRVSGINKIPPISGGSQGRYLEQVLEVALHEIDSYTFSYAFDTSITNGIHTAITGSATDGQISGGTYQDRMWLRRYTGTATQTVDWILNNRYSTVFTSDFRGRGRAYVACTYDWGDGKLYAGGLPLMTFQVKGKKCYDPRDDSTNGGSGTARLNDITTWAYTNNPALGWADYLMSAQGGRVSSNDIDWPSVIVAAGICSTAVAVPVASTQSRYTFNGRFGLVRDWRDNARLFVDAMLGRMVRRGKKWYIYAGAYEAASATIDKEDWLSIDSIKTVAPRDGGRWNTVRCWYTDPSRNHQREECFPRRNATFKSSDGAEEITLEMDQPACTEEYQAQRKAEFVLRQSRNQVAIVGRLGPRFRSLATGETVELNFVDFGWATKTFKLRAMDLLPDGSVRVACVEEQSTDWTDLLEAEYNAESVSTLPSVNPTSPSQPLSFDGDVIGGVLSFNWDQPDVVPVGTRYRLYSYPGSLSNVNSKVLVWEGLATQKTIQYAVNTPLWFQIQAVSNSYTSAYQPNTYGIGFTPAVAPPYVPTGWNASIVPTSRNKSAQTSILTTLEATVTIAGSVAPVFSWTNPSSVNIKINSVGLNRTTFTGSGVSINTSRAGKFWCNIKDGANAASLSCDVYVEHVGNDA